MCQDSTNWEEIDREYFELWDWIVRKCDGDWTKKYEGRSERDALEYRTNQERFVEIQNLLLTRAEPYYFCWIDLRREVWQLPYPNANGPMDCYPVYGKVVNEYAFLKIDHLTFGRARDIKWAIDEGFRELRLHESDKAGIYNDPTAKSFFFCRNDFRYPHRRQELSKFWGLFEKIAEIEHFGPGTFADASALAGNPFSQWKHEPITQMEYWSPEHVHAVEEYFIVMAEEDSQVWLNRLNAEYAMPTASRRERYLREIYRYWQGQQKQQARQSHEESCPINAILPPPLLNEDRAQACYEAYMRRENLKIAGERIGVEHDKGAISAKTVASDAELYAKVRNKVFEKRPRGRPPSL